MQEQKEGTGFLAEFEALRQKAAELMERGDFARAEGQAIQGMNALCGKLLGGALEEVLSRDSFRSAVRELGARKALRFRGDEELTVRLGSGTKVKIRSPYFVAAERKPGRKRRKPGPAGKGCHLALNLFGFINQCSPAVCWGGLQMASLCPSYETAAMVMASQGGSLSAQQLMKLTRKFSDLADNERVRLGIKKDDSLAGKRVCLSIDGGRYRERKNKKGPVPKSAKRRGYHSDWKEPMLFYIGVLGDDGKQDRRYPVHVDGSTGDKEKFTSLLREQLRALGIHQARHVTLVADGDSWNWDHVPKLLEDLGVEPDRVSQVMDWCHAKQNLHQQFERLEFCLGSDALHEELEAQLWRGDIDALTDLLRERAASGYKRKVDKKCREYFQHHRQRMQYESAKAARIPTGSGYIESAIRRVLNMRVKSTGSFWHKKNSEALIFLRSKLLYGQWETLKENYAAPIINEFQAVLAEQQRLAA